MDPTAGKVGILFLYGYLLVMNYFGFRKLRRLKPEKWTEFEGNPVSKWMMKKIGLVKSYSVSFIVAVLMVMIINDDFTLGMALGVILFNVLHDSIEFDEIIKRREPEK
jgi:hypothetical protein